MLCHLHQQTPDTASRRLYQNPIAFMQGNTLESAIISCATLRRQGCCRSKIYRIGQNSHACYICNGIFSVATKTRESNYSLTYTQTFNAFADCMNKAADIIA